MFFSAGQILELLNNYKIIIICLCFQLMLYTSDNHKTHKMPFKRELKIHKISKESVLSNFRHKSYAFERGILLATTLRISMKIIIPKAFDVSI